MSDADAGERESRARQARSDYAAISRARDDIAVNGWEQRLDELGQARELREAIARWLCERRNGGGGWDHMPGRRYWLEDADALLAGPLASLLAAQAAVERVEALAAELEREWAVTAAGAGLTPEDFAEVWRSDAANRIRAAVRGTP